MEDGIDFVAFLEAGDTRARGEDCARRIRAGDDGNGEWVGV